MKRLLSILLLVATVSGCAHTRPRTRHPADPLIAVGAGLVILAGVALLYGLIAECEQPGGNCSTGRPQYP